MFPQRRTWNSHRYMDGLMIEARSLESARGIEAALRGFEREVVTEDGRHCVHVTLPPGNRGIIALLNALEEYVSQRGDGPARVEYDGRTYTMDASLPGLN